MVVLEQSPWYHEIHARGEQVGLERGRQIEETYLLQRMLEKRFGPLPPEVPPRLAALNEEAIEALLDEVITAASLDEVLAHLQQVSK